MHHSIDLFQITSLMHNSFILQLYVGYITILNMFQAARCSPSGGQIVLPQPLVPSPSVNSRTVCRLRADSSSAKRVDVVYVRTGQRMLIDFHTVEGSSLIAIHRCRRSTCCEDAIDVNSDAGLSF